jgi:hypothetical protein
MKKRLGYSLGDFFTNSSGHPGSVRMKSDGRSSKNRPKYTSTRFSPFLFLTVKKFWLLM